MPLPLPWLHPMEAHRTCLNSSALCQLFRYLKAALMSPLSFFSRLNIALAAIAHMTWLNLHHCPHHFPLDGYQLFTVLLNVWGPGGTDLRGEERSRTLTYSYPHILLSQPSLEGTPCSLQQQKPSIFLTRAAVKPRHPLWDWAAVF